MVKIITLKNIKFIEFEVPHDIHKIFVSVIYYFQ